jgi:hypothetical protein
LAGFSFGFDSSGIGHVNTMSTKHLDLTDKSFRVIALKVIGARRHRTLGSNLYRSASLAKVVCSPGSLVGN